MMDHRDSAGGSTEDRRNSPLGLPFPPPPRALSPLAAPYTPLPCTSRRSPVLSHAPPFQHPPPADPSLGADGGSQMTSLLIPLQSSQQALPQQSWWSDTIGSFDQHRHVSIPEMITAPSVTNHAASTASLTTQDINGVVMEPPQQHHLQSIIHDVSYGSRMEDHRGWVSGNGEMMPLCISSQSPATVAQDHLLRTPSFSPRLSTTLCHNLPLMDYSAPGPPASGSHFLFGEGEQMMLFPMSLQSSLHSPMGFDGSFSVSPALSYHTAAVPVTTQGAVVLPTLQQQHQLPMDFDPFPDYREDSEHLQLDEQIQHMMSTFCSSQPSLLPLSPLSSLSPTELMNLSVDHISPLDPVMIPGPAEANQAAAEPIGLGNSTGGIPKPPREELLHKIQTMFSKVYDILAQKNPDELQSLLNFLTKFHGTQLRYAEERCAQHSGGSGCSMSGSTSSIGIIRLEQSEESTSGRRRYRSAVWMYFAKRHEGSDVTAVCKLCNKSLPAAPKLFGTSYLIKHLRRHPNLPACSDALKPKPLTKDKGREMSEIKPMELGNTEDVQIQQDDMPGKYNEGVKVNPNDKFRNYIEDMEFVDPVDILRKHTEVEIGIDDMSRKCMEDVEVQPRDMSRKHPKNIEIGGISKNCINLLVVGPHDSSRKQSKISEVEPGYMSRKRAKKTKVEPGDMSSKRAKNAKVESSHMSRKGTSCNRRQKSGVWDHMHKDYNVSKAICTHCQKKLSYDKKNGTTTHLERHLKQIHGIVVVRRSDENQEETGIDNQGKDQAAAESCGIMPDEVSNNDVIIMDFQNTGDTVGKISVLEEQLLFNINSAPEQEVLVQIDDVTIQKDILKSLADPNLEDGPQKYLQDNIIDAYICILKAKNKYGMRAHGRIYIETTIGCQLLCKNAISISERKDKKKYGIKYLKHDMIFLPMNQNRNHWFLAVINTKTQEIQVLDSLRKPFQEREELKYTLKHIEQCLELASNGVQSGSWPDYKVSSWTVTEVTQVPKQTDRSSCGLFLIKYIEYWTGEKLSKRFVQADIDVFRRKLAAELMSSPLNTAGK